MKIATLCLIFVFLTLAANAPTGFAYVLFGVTACLFTLDWIWRRSLLSMRLSGHHLIDFVPAIFVILWVYGVLLGLVLGNTPSYVFSNFAGMLVYLAYYFMRLADISKEKLFRVVYGAAILVTFISIFVSLLYFVFGILTVDNPVLLFILGPYDSAASTGQIRLFSISQMAMYVIFAVSMWSFLNPQEDVEGPPSSWAPKSGFSAIIWMLLTSYALVIVPASKGITLGLVVLAGCLFLARLLQRPTLSSLVRTVSIGVLAGLAVLAIAATTYGNIASAIFAQNDISNVVRYSQLTVMLQHLSLFGAGLGSTIPGLIRAKDAPYGFELVYVNLVHKFGVFSIVLFWAYLYTLWRAYKGLFDPRTNPYYAAAAFGAMMYVFPALGNPILLAPNVVVLHCASLFWLRDKETAQPRYVSRVTAPTMQPLGVQPSL